VVVLAGITAQKTARCLLLVPLSMTTVWRLSVHTLNCEHMNIQGEVCNESPLIEKEEKVTAWSKIAVDNIESCIMYVTVPLMKIQVF
jgi:hypothetical protein